MNIRILALLPVFLLLTASAHHLGAEESMDKMWGEQSSKNGQENSARVALFRDGNYGMFMHWGLYSHLGGQWKDRTFYGIGEWIKRQMRISDEEYKGIAAEFNPSEFNAKEIVRVAKEAGMKWIIVTSKHHEGFAMFKSKDPFNIVDATPFKRDPMKELAAACREAGLGFGFYYSHNQDWIAPGGSGGPSKNPDGTPATFERYFREKCFPQVQEICTNYGPLAFIWFDTPGKMPKEMVLELADLVHKTQPNALMCSRVGHGLGDYTSRGDMEVPVRNFDGLWETCDTTNDSWSYAWYDQNFKDAKQILSRLVATIGRGGTYLLNVGPDGKGRIPKPAADFLVESGKWIKRHPKVIYGAGPSPWGHALAWGDVTSDGNTLNLVVFDWPGNGKLMLPGLQGEIAEAAFVKDGKMAPVPWSKSGAWTVFQVPSTPPDAPASVLRVSLKSSPKADSTFGIYPNVRSPLPVEFADVQGAEKKRITWMDKFGEWKFANQVSEWQPGGSVTWDVDVAEAGPYHLELIYRGAGRTAWSIQTDEGTKLQNQQGGTSIYQAYPFGILSFQKPGRHRITVSLAAGDPKKSSLESLLLSPVN
jgi:alpha-L-fucosidase